MSRAPRHGPPGDSPLVIGLTSGAMGSMNVRMGAFAHERRSRRGWRDLWLVDSICRLRFSETQMDLCEKVSEESTQFHVAL